MKKIFLILALAFAFTTGMTAIRGLHARTTTLPVYVVVEIDEITDADGFEALRQTAAATDVEVQFEDESLFRAYRKCNRS
jgi:D-aminopeptidase